MTQPNAQLNTQPSVTVVVPAYNQAQFLSRAIESLFAQSYPQSRFEIILVDDGSTDATASVATDLSARWDGHMHVVTKRNGGPASARNAGLAKATGEIVAFMDSDCTASPDWLEALVAPFADAKVAGVGGPILNAHSERWVTTYIDATGLYRHRMRHGSVDYLLTASVAFRREALLSVGGFHEEAWAEDADLSFRLRAVGYELALANRGSVTHYGSPASVAALARELHRYGYGNCLQSKHWRNERTPLWEFIRHAGAVGASPYLAFKLAPRLGVARAASCWPLVVVEHASFCVGLVNGLAHRHENV